MSLPLLRAPLCAAALALGCMPALAGAAPAAAHRHPKPKHEAVRPHKLDLSGQPRRGKASYYARSFKDKKMADGTPMNPNAKIAASKTLPLGTKAKVTNLETGKSEVVEIRDRGPYIDGRIVDLSPRVAADLDMKKDGVAPVVVTPLTVPLPDGGVKLGEALADQPSAAVDADR